MISFTWLPAMYLRPSYRRATFGTASSAALVGAHLLEIRKVERAAGGDLSPADRELLVEIANVFVKAGGTLTQDIAALI